MNEFYVGYAPKMPIGLRAFVHRVVVTLGLLAIAVAVILLFGQMPFAKSTFEFGQGRAFEGILETTPYPSLLVDRPGAVESSSKYSRYLLVAPGKQGADMLFGGMNGKRARFKGELIYRAGQSMIEVEPESVQLFANPGLGSAQFHSLGEVSVTGEIVDSKCYLGVMNPGEGKVHRDCASRCISGGVPPIFVTSSGDQFLLVGPDEQPFERGALRKFIAEPISLHGEFLERGDSRFLKINLAELHHGN
jgi:hypothetical protein